MKVYTTETEVGEELQKDLLWVHQMVENLESVERLIEPKDVNIVILSGLTSQNDAEV